MENHFYAKGTVRAAVRCPRCNAYPGFHCWGSKGQLRKANHKERVDLYVGTRVRA